MTDKIAEDTIVADAESRLIEEGVLHVDGSMDLQRLGVPSTEEGVRDYLRFTDASLPTASPDEVPRSIVECAKDPLPEPLVYCQRTPVVSRGRLSLLTGFGGSGKSTLALHWAVTMALAESRNLDRFCPATELGWRARRGLCLYASYEDDDSVQGQRASLVAPAICAGSTIEELESLQCWKLSTPLLSDFGADGMDWHWPNGVRFAAWVLRNRPSMVMIDPLTALGETDYNDPFKSRSALHCLERLAVIANCGILLVAHPNKSGPGKEMNSLLGSVSWYNAPRTILALQRETKYVLAGEPVVHNLRSVKASYGKPVSVKLHSTLPHEDAPCVVGFRASSS